MRLVNAGQDYARIERTWTLKMVLQANRAMDIQEMADKKAVRRAREKAQQKGK